MRVSAFVPHSCGHLISGHQAIRPSGRDILGDLDAMKLRSSLTLSAQAQGGDGRVFAAALLEFYDGVSDGRTLAILNGG